MARLDNPYDYQRLVHELPARILLHLNASKFNTSFYKLNRKVGNSRRQNYRALENLRRYGFVKIENSNGEDKIILTDKGRKCAEGMALIASVTKLEQV